MSENARNFGTSQSAAQAERLVAKRTLKRRARVGEEVIRSLLLLCGVISIFTTIGIVVTLGSQARFLFTQYTELNTNNRLVSAIDAETTMLELTSGGSTFQVDNLLKVGTEFMLVTEVIDADTLTVIRGYNNTEIKEHPLNAPIFREEQVTLVDFFTGIRWQPQIGEFGILPLLNATLLTSLLAMSVSLPIGLGTAIYLSEYAPRNVRAVLKPLLEILAGVPTVVYGYFALTFMTPLLRSIFGENQVEIFNMASAGLVMGIMIIPTISSMSEDALSAVPSSLREASYGLGATKFETTTQVLVPAALSGIIASFILGFSRAVGETMIVAIASGAGPNLTYNLFQAAETITGHIVRISTGDISYQSVDYNSLFALGLTLFFITLILNIISGWVTRRFREVYQ